MLASIGLAGASACTRVGGEHRATTGSTTSTTTTSAPKVDPDSVLRRQLERATFGLTPTLWDHVSSIGFERWLDDQLTAPDSLGGSIDDPYAAGFTLVDATIPTAAQIGGVPRQERQRFRPALMQGIGARVILRAALAPDQVRQRLVDTFADLLHVSSAEAPTIFGLDEYDRLLRTNVLGRFADLLAASATSTAMLSFLDNASSRADGGRHPNENFARELMELHTVGVDGGYAEGDVVEAAHVFSGWSVDRSGSHFEFRAPWHDLGRLASGGDILGWRPTGDGEAAGRSLLDHLAHHPATARRIAHELARRFVSESLSPDDPIVERAAEVYLAQDTSIAAVVRELLTSPDFATRSTLMARRPIDLLATLVRRAAPAPDPAQAVVLGQELVALSTALGQSPYGWPGPDGYIWASGAWTNAGALIARWNAVTTVAGTLTWPGAADPSSAVLTACGPEIQVF
ncbi:DUF1800 domain-containing protein [soil metagenome]